MRIPAAGKLLLAECQNTTRHDAAAAVLVNGSVYALAAERVDRIKHSCDAGAAYGYLAKRLLAHQTPLALDCAYTPYREPNHHLAHAASAYFASPFSEALVLVLDGMGPHARGTSVSTSLWHGRGHQLALIESIEEPGICYRSAGHFYAAASYYLGFPFYDVSYTMSLAAYGDPRPYRAAVASLIWPTADGLFETDRDFIRFATWLRFGQDFGWNADAAWLARQGLRYRRLLGPPRQPGQAIETRHKDLAAAVQERLESIVHALFMTLRARVPDVDTLCYAGGIALNCVANARVLPATRAASVFIQPAASDDGIALGRLLWRIYNQHRVPRHVHMQHACLGPPYARAELERAIDRVAPYVRAERMSRRALVDEAADRIARGQVLAWFQGRSEFGPRALGHRSVLADPQNPAAVAEIARKFKAREWFRPFAPSVLESRVPMYFHTHSSIRQPLRFMLAAVDARQAARVPFAGALHTDGSARVHSVADTGTLYSALVHAFWRRTGVPGLLNTSLNTPGQPMVETPADAIEVFMSSQLDALVLGPWLVERKG